MTLKSTKPRKKIWIAGNKGQCLISAGFVLPGNERNLLVTRAVRRRVKFSVAFANSFLFIYFFLGGGGGGRDRPRDKTSGHELSSRSRSLYSGRVAPS